MKNKTKLHAFLLFIGIILWVFFGRFTNNNSQSHAEQTTTCPDYTFFVEETNSCVPFRNDHQAEIYKLSKPPLTSAKI